MALARDISVRTDPARPVRLLAEPVARKIAAGEVIDRPAAVVRELIDNAIDSGATKISVEISGGGADYIRVTDNGCGMTPEDLKLCTHTHSTSKIENEQDLLTLQSLGFRGEALASIDAVSRLLITTSREGHGAWSRIDGRIEPALLQNGTAIEVSGLFLNFPARRQFLKRTSAESALCRQTFLDKALVWPSIEFRFSSDGKPRDILLPVPALRDRVLEALGPDEPASFFYEIAGNGDGFSFTAVIGGPETARADRKHLYTFVNGRRVQEYSLLQAVEYGCEGFFPNGSHPLCVLDVHINPALVDFNIHPAKREVRFMDKGPLHHAISATIREFWRHRAPGLTNASLQDYTDSPGFVVQDLPNLSEPGTQSMYDSTTPSVQTLFSTGARALAAAACTGYTETGINRPVSDTSGVDTHDFRYLGQVLGTFLVAELHDILYLIDQHAAHERLLFDRLRKQHRTSQELLVPYRIQTTEHSEDERLRQYCAPLAEAGFTLADEGDGIWQVSSVPVLWKGSEGDLQKELLEPTLTPERLIDHLYARAACRAACKDGDLLDPEAACRLISETFDLPEPVCPHGRPVWIRLDRPELFRLVERT